MSAETGNPGTRVLAATGDEDPRAASRLLPQVYTELRKLAQYRMARLMPGQTLQPTALVHEAYMRLVRHGDPGWNGRGHFFGAAALAMRDIIVEQARRKATLKHGGDRRRLAISDAERVPEPRGVDVVAVDEVLRTLEAEDPRKGEIVNLRYFVGMTSQETAALMGLSVSTVEREWRYVRAWLHTQLAEIDERDGAIERPCAGAVAPGPGA